MRSRIVGRRTGLGVVAAVATLTLSASPLTGQVPTPVSHFGFVPGTERELANWDELSAYYDALARTSPRVAIDTLGSTTKGLPFVMMTITSPENHARLVELQEINHKLADPRRISGQEELEQLIADGRSIVLITQHIHSTEVGSGQMAANLAHRLASSDDPKVLDILDNVVLLHIPSLNPDGTQWTSNWYNEWKDTPHENSPMPWLYHFYVGHDNNRDWYAFRQVETQLTVTKGHNAWRPHIVHDVHQMGNSGARLFIPPYIDPIEPNVDPHLVSALNQLGPYMAAEVMSEGKSGVVINGIYDAYTPARAYSHYHAGVRILTETASAKWAGTINQSEDEIRGGREYDAATSSWNYPDPWRGGDWGLPDIVDYQESAAMALLTNAARNRDFWVRNFYNISQRAVDRWPSWPHAWIVPAEQRNQLGVESVLRILRMADVEVHTAESGFSAGEREYPAGTYVIPMNQPYASFAQTMLDVQEYPDMREYPGGPPKRPYDVTAHSLPLLMGIEAAAVDSPVDVELSDPIPVPEVDYTLPAALTGAEAPRVAVYKGRRESMPAGWTRWMLDQHALPYDTLHDRNVRAGDLTARYDVILFQDQSPDAIVDGFSADQVPPEYAGGLGDEGVAAIRTFVEDGGRIIAIESAAQFAIETLGLDIDDGLRDLENDDFYIPGSILRLRMDPTHPIADDLDQRQIAWFSSPSRTFDVRDPRVEVVARYDGDADLRAAGWILGGEHVAGRPAIVEAAVGSGSAVLFGFQPDYRGQTVATWPILFNAMTASPAATAEVADR